MKKVHCLVFILLAFLLVNKAEAQDSIPPNGKFTTLYYPGGEKSSEGYLVNGKPDGYWKTFYQNGNIKSEGNRKNFHLDGIWKFYNAEGAVSLEISYQNDKKNGLKKTYKEKETVEENFLDDIKQGWTKVYFPDGKIKKESFFEKGKLQGISKEYSIDGRVITITEYRRGFIIFREKINRYNQQNQKQGLWKEFWENGKIREEGWFRRGIKDGYFKTYNQKGELQTVYLYRNGILQENVEELSEYEIKVDYYPDGKPKVIGSYKNGKPDGIRREYDQDGQIVKGYVFSKGQLIGAGIVDEQGFKQGPWKEYYRSGQLKAEGTYKNNIRIKKWVFYHENGEIENTGNFNSKGKPIGQWKWYYDNKVLRRDMNFRRGLPDGIMTEYSDSATIIAKGEYLDGFEEGPWIFVIGDERMQGNFVNGVRDGEWKHTYPDGKISYQGKFVDGNEDGKHTWYYPDGKIKKTGFYVMGTREGDWNFYYQDETPSLIITYKNGIEVKYNGVKVKPAIEADSED